ncbi:MAG: TIGR04013 family B12-binding domain/radical SAM domain-containing protein [Thermodesulfobacteria bacterium]|nr:TIGR04013 family B12-binding domain/radical SAM domain-containing protein [Thermodesulfobacteriota bacterium]
MKPLALVLIETDVNKYSINALAGVVEVLSLKELDFFVFRHDSKDSVSELILNLKNLLEEYKKVIVGFSFCTPELWESYNLISRLKEEFRREKERLILIAGGPHPTGDRIGTLRAGIDVVFVGESESSLSEYIKAILKGDSIEKIKGLVFKDGDRIVFTGMPRQINLDEYPPLSFKYDRIGPIEITRGCPYGCFYCQTTRIFGAKVRHRSLEVILECVEKMVKRNLKDMRFITPNAFSYGSKDGKVLNLEALEGLLKELDKLVRKRGGRVFFGTFPSEVRPEHVTEETLLLLKKYADNKSLIIGAQSGSDRILKLCNRQHTVEDVIRAVKLCVKFGFKPKVDFIFGLPGETEEDIKQTIDVIERLIKLGAVIHAHTFMPLPQTPFAKKPPGRIKPEVLKLINKLLGKGLLFGKWQEQEKLAEKISSYLRETRVL